MSSDNSHRSSTLQDLQDAYDLADQIDPHGTEDPVVVSMSSLAIHIEVCKGGVLLELDPGCALALGEKLIKLAHEKVTGDTALN